MLRFSAIVVFIFAFCFSVFAQFEEYFVPAKWELYSVEDKKISFLMPRLPVLIKNGDMCRDESFENYAAYNDGAVFTVRITSKVKGKNYCVPESRKDFDEKNFADRIKELKKNWMLETNLDNGISKDSAVIFKGTNKILKLVNDYDNKRWFEFAINGADDSKKEVANFLSSLKNETSGIVIGEGADRSYGDDASESIVEVKTINDGVTQTIKQLIIKTENKTTQGLTIITKPPPRYTDAARKNNIKGTVVLKVTFLANGAIGNIEPVDELPFGLTEQAIVAARKIGFIPAQSNGQRFSVTKKVAYGFSIY